MPSIRIQNFGGIAPRMSARLLAGGAALRAELTKLWSGEIRPFFVKVKVETPLVQGCMAKTIYKFKDAWLSWCADVDVVTGFTIDKGSERLYYTGDGPPKVTTYPLAFASLPTPSNSLMLGVAQPVLPPTLGTPTGPATTPQLRYYVYTWYTQFDEESVPSPPSVGINVSDGQTVPVTIPVAGVSLPPNLESVRLYRTNGGPFLFVSETPIAVVLANPVINDAVKNIDLGEALISQSFYPPPNNIHGLIGLASGSFAAFHDNRVVFSEPYQPHAWPPEYEKIFDYPVVALGTYGNTLVVATTGYTYLVSGIDPRSQSVDRVPDPYPCVSKRSMVSADHGVIYASAEGLVFVGLGGTQVLTRELMTREEWQRFNPSTMHGVIFDGRYFGFYQSTRFFRAEETVVPSGAGFIFDFNDRVVQGVDDNDLNRDDKLITIPFYASATFANPVVTLHLVINPSLKTNELFKWEGGQDFETYVWRSKQFAFPYEVTFACAKVLRQCTSAQQVKFRLCDGACGEVLFERDILSSRPFRLPSKRPRTDWIVEIEGNAAVQEIHVSTSMNELAEGSAQ